MATVLLPRVVRISLAPPSGGAAVQCLGWVALLCGVALGQDEHGALLFDECHARHSQSEGDTSCCVGDNMPCDVTQPAGGGSRRRLAAADQHPPWEAERRRLGHCCDQDLFCQCLEGANTCGNRQRPTAGCDGPVGLCCPQPLEISSHASPLQSCSASSWMSERVPSLPPSLFSVSAVTATDDWTQLSFVSAVPGSVSVGGATVQLAGVLLPPSDRGDCGSYDDSQWVVCAAERGECSCPSGLVRYGSFRDATAPLVEPRVQSGGTWTEWMPMPIEDGGTVQCSNAVFGDPLVGVGKECHCQVPVVSPDRGIFTAQLDACDVLCLQQAASSPVSSEPSQRPCAHHALRFGQGDSEYELRLTFGGNSPASPSASGEPGTYTLTAWAKVTTDYDGRPQMLHSRFWDANGAELGITSDGWPSATLGEWERISVTFDTGTARPARMAWYVGYYQRNTVGNTYITELQVMGPSGEAMLADGSFDGGQHMSSWSEADSYGEYDIIELPRHSCGVDSLGRGVPISSTVPIWAASSGPSGSQLLYGDVVGAADVSSGDMMLFSHLNYRAGLNPTDEASARITSLTDENVIVRRHGPLSADVPEIDGVTTWVLQAGEEVEIPSLQTGEYFTASGAAYGVVQRDDIVCDEPATALVEPMLSSSFAGIRFVVDGLKQQHDVDDGPIRAGDFVYELFASCLRDVCELQIGGMSTSVSSGSMERVDLTTSRLTWMQQHFPDGPVEVVSSAPLVAALHAFPLTIPLIPASTTLYGITSAVAFDLVASGRECSNIAVHLGTGATDQACAKLVRDNPDCGDLFERHQSSGRCSCVAPGATCAESSDGNVNRFVMVAPSASSPAPLVVGETGTFGAWEAGFCVDIDGRDVNDLVHLFLSGNEAGEKKQECLELCAAEPQYVGCEVIWDQGNAGCYGHASTAVVSGNGAERHSCSIREAPAEVAYRQEHECRNVGGMWACRYQAETTIPDGCPWEEEISCVWTVLGGVLWGVHWFCWNFEGYRQGEVRWQVCKHFLSRYSLCSTRLLDCRCV